MNMTVKELSEKISDPDGREFAVYYAKDPTFVPDPELTIQRLARTHSRVMSLRIRKENNGKTYRTLVLLENVYERMQGEIWSPNGEAREVVRALGLHHTSMSVGDVIFDAAKEKYYQVGILGFKRIPE